jgi:hypothetical protein
MTASLLRSLFWTTDEDGERVHRLESEWDGNKGATNAWGRYRVESDQWELSYGATWSRWMFGLEAEYGHERGWDYTRRVRVDYRRQRVTVAFGPWYVTWLRCKPLPTEPA